METVITVSAFLGAAIVGKVAGNVQVTRYLAERRWLRVMMLAMAFLLIVVIVTGGLPRP